MKLRTEVPVVPVVAALAAALALVSSPSSAGDTVNVLVLKEHGVGTAAQAQPYVDKLMAAAAKANGWSAAKGGYHTGRADAEKWIGTEKPRYGILSLAAFLGLRGKHNLEVVGQVSAARAGGQQYHLISKTQSDAAGCKGKALATDHGDDVKFVDNVVFGGKQKLADFKVVTTTRPIQTLKKVTAGEADCALIDDAQLAELAKVEGGAAVKSVWKSDKLPPMVVVAFPSAPAADKKTFQTNLGKLCEGDGKTVCSEVGISSMKSASSADYQAVITAYGK